MSGADSWGAGSLGEGAGSLGEEAARLAGAVHDWAGRHGFGEHVDAAFGSFLGPARGAAGEGGFATGAPECRLCPVCQLVTLLRATRPEVYGHLADALASLAAAAREVAASDHARAPREARVQRIDIT